MGTNLTWFKYDLFQNNLLVSLLSFFFTPEDLLLSSFIHCTVLFCHTVLGKETTLFCIRFLVLLAPFALIFPHFLQCYFFKLKNGNSVLFNFMLSSEQFEVNNLLIKFFAHSIFLAFVAGIGTGRWQFHAGEEG